VGVLLPGLVTSRAFRAPWPGMGRGGGIGRFRAVLPAAGASGAL